MKKRKPLRRNRPLRRRAGMQSKGGLRPGKPLKRGKPLGRSALLRELPASWRTPHTVWVKTVTAPGVCAICGWGPRAREVGIQFAIIDPHHVVPQRYLRRYVASFRKLFPPDEYEALLVRLLFDVRNGLALCRQCHDAHETQVRPVPRDLLPESAFVFANEVGLGYVIDRFYPT